MTSPDVRAPSWGAQLSWGERTLAGAGLPSPWRDALVLLMHLVNAPRTLVLAHPERTLAPADVTRFASWINRRAHGEPVPYITGHQVFMGLDLQVDRRTALARPSTACVIEMALECLRNRSPAERELLVAEVGTGCGALALALGLFEPRIAHIYAVDPSAGALEVARANGDRYLLNLSVSWLTGDGLEPIPEPVDLIVANRSYWRSETERAALADLEAKRPDISRYEPHPADWSAGAGGDGDAGDAEEAKDDEMARLSTLIALARAKLRPGGTLLFVMDAVKDRHLRAVGEMLGTALPQAHVWIETPQASDERLVIAQLSR